jgi:glycosyltransferase involved in cell wall biosynthesis
MTIILINTQKGWRGGERQLAWLIEGLQDLNYNQILFCRKNSALEKYAISNNLNYRSFKITFYTLPFLAFTLFKIIQKENNKVVVDCHDSKSHTIGLLTKLFFTKKFKLLVHRKVIFPVTGWFSKKVKYSSTYVDSVICISKAIAKEIKTNDSTLRTVIIYDAIKPIPFINSTFLLQQTNKKNALFIGYIAALTEEKDHVSFLKTAQKLADKNINFHFVIIGIGKLKNELQQLTKDLGIENRVTFLGFLNNLNEVIPQIDLLLFTSKSEGLGSTILDFFMAKKPVVTVKNGGSEELVFNNETGFITQIGDITALTNYCLTIFSDTENTNRMVTNAYTFACNNFNIDKMVSATSAEYVYILKK